jgi:peptide-methionine (R)-S-oxide reductase
MTDRRKFLKSSVLTLTGAGAAAWLGAPSFLRAAAGGNDGQVRVIAFSDTGKKLGPQNVQKVVKTDAEWQRLLTPLQFEVTRHAGTERAFTGAYAETHEKGLYRCICCGNALFSSDTKFDSGTGWPSFWAPISKENVRTSEDKSLFEARTAVACAECDAHLGHVFDDGPRPTGLRYCMNSASLRFVKHA